MMMMMMMMSGNQLTRFTWKDVWEPADRFTWKDVSGNQLTGSPVTLV